MTDATVGDPPILDPGPIVEIEGTAYPIRRLGIRDTFTVARIVAIGAGATNRPLNNTEMSDPNRMAELFLAGFVAAEKAAFELLANLIGVTTKDLENPDRFPMGSELRIIEALVQHQDLKAFFAQAGELMKRLPETRTRSGAHST